MAHIVYGKRPVTEALRFRIEAVQALYLDPGRRAALSDIIDLAAAAQLEIRWESKKNLEKIAGRSGHQGAVAELKAHDYVSIKMFLQRKTKPPRTILALDGITDPQNFGACLRAAGAFGADLVLTTKRRSAPVTPAVVKASAGAAEVVPIARESNLVNSLNLLKKEGFWVFGLAAEADAALPDADLPPDIVLVLGSEGDGLHRLVEETCDQLLRIPAGGPIASLNVAQAATVALYEVFRSRLRD
ncbi:MAG: 23S rRNA (guanosine(2251)-2'-O)-methyltransferase RlmB [Candidatus Lernaella stagnicola]|nr:23S rRNA (guanosine(2251)-2'-O)-methyltransferase RlmB [Candidatus Lernaella stagnicola]